MNLSMHKSSLKLKRTLREGKGPDSKPLHHRRKKGVALIKRSLNGG